MRLPFGWLSQKRHLAFCFSSVSRSIHAGAAGFRREKLEVSPAKKASLSSLDWPNDQKLHGNAAARQRNQPGSAPALRPWSARLSNCLSRFCLRS